MPPKNEKIIMALDNIESGPPAACLLSDAYQTGELETVKKLCRWVNEIMVVATNTGVIHANPLSGIGKAFSLPKAVKFPSLARRSEKEATHFPGLSIFGCTGCAYE